MSPARSRPPEPWLLPGGCSPTDEPTSPLPPTFGPPASSAAFAPESPDGAVGPPPAGAAGVGGVTGRSPPVLAPLGTGALPAPRLPARFVPGAATDGPPRAMPAPGRRVGFKPPPATGRPRLAPPMPPPPTITPGAAAPG